MFQSPGFRIQKAKISWFPNPHCFKCNDHSGLDQAFSLSLENLKIVSWFWFTQASRLRHCLSFDLRPPAKTRSFVHTSDDLLIFNHYCKKISRERTTAVTCLMTSLLSKQWPLKWANGFLFWRSNKHALFYLRYWCIDTIRVLNVEESYFIIIKLTKPWTPNIFMEWYCVARKKPIKC